MTTHNPTAHPLWAAGDAGYHTYRIPALTVTTNGTVLAFAEARRDGGGDAGEIHLVVRRSHDHGRTWEPTRIVSAEPGFTTGNPAPVVDSRTGDVILLLTRNPADHGETDVCAGKAERTVWVTRSSDDGATWSDPVDITSDVKDPSWTWYATGPCHGVQLRTGRLVVACDHAVGVSHDRWSDPFRSHVIYSDDGGATWHIGGTLPDGTNESTVTELGGEPAGRVYVNARSHDGSQRRGSVVSTDGGVTFGEYTRHDDLVEPPCQGSVVTTPAGTVLFANPASTERRKLTIRASADDGATWSAGFVLHEGPSAYSDLAITADDHLLCLYEHGETSSPYETIRLVRMPLNEAVDRAAAPAREGERAADEARA